MLTGRGDPSLRIGMTSTWRCHFEQSEKSLHCCHEKREPLIMLSCRNPRGTNFVCASRDHLLPALSIPAAFVATLVPLSKEGQFFISSVTKVTAPLQPRGVLNLCVFVLMCYMRLIAIFTPAGTNFQF